MTFLRCLFLSSLLIVPAVYASATEYSEDADDYQDKTATHVYPYYQLPLTEKDFRQYDDSIDLDQLPITDPKLLEQLATLQQGASDSGFFQLQAGGGYQAFVSFGLYEDEGDAYVTEDNPDGAYVDQENVLVLLKNQKLLIVTLDKGFRIDKNFNVTYD